MAHLIVVGTDKGCVFLWIGLTLKHNNRDAFVVSTVDGWRYRRELVGSHNQQVDATFDKTVDLLRLPLWVVVGRGKAQFHSFVEIGFHLHLWVLPVTPDVFGALRDANDVLGPLLRARNRQHRNHCHTQQYAGGIGKRVLYLSHL